MKPSELFEGESSSLRKTFDEAVKEFNAEFLRKGGGLLSTICSDQYGSTIKNEDSIKKFLLSSITKAYEAGYEQGKKDAVEMVNEVMEDIAGHEVYADEALDTLLEKIKLQVK